MEGGLSKKNLNIYLRYIIGVFISVGLIYHIHSKEDIIPILVQFEFNKIFTALIIICFHLGCLFIMWRKIVVDVGQFNPGYGMLFHSFFGGRTLGFITPGQTGELLKGMFFSSSSRLQGTSLSMIFSGYSMIIRTIMGSIACIYFVLNMPDYFTIDLNYYLLFILPITIIIALNLMI